MMPSKSHACGTCKSKDSCRIVVTFDRMYDDNRGPSRRKEITGQSSSFFMETL